MFASSSKLCVVGTVLATAIAWALQCCSSQSGSLLSDSRFGDVQTMARWCCCCSCRRSLLGEHEHQLRDPLEPARQCHVQYRLVIAIAVVRCRGRQL